MIKHILIVVVVGVSFTSAAQKLQLKWKTDTLLSVSESVLVDSERDVLYVSCIKGTPDGKDGNGFIAKVSSAGKIISPQWVKGLDAPKGMGLFKNTLYVVDISKVVAIDVVTGKIIQAIEIPGAVFLNDITIDPQGNIYISDTGTNKIHRLKENQLELYFESPDLKGVNGLLSIKEGLYVVSFGEGTNFILTTNKKLIKRGITSKGADGIVSVGKNEYLVSNWGGEVYFVGSNGKSKKVLDTQALKLNSADIAYDHKTKTLYVPTFFANSVMAYAYIK